MYHFFTDPYNWTESDVSQWLQWLSHHFGLPDVDLEKFKVSGKELCELRVDEFCTRTHEYMGDIIFEYLCKFKEGVCVCVCVCVLCVCMCVCVHTYLVYTVIRIHDVLTYMYVCHVIVTWLVDHTQKTCSCAYKETTSMMTPTKYKVYVIAILSLIQVCTCVHVYPHTYVCRSIGGLVPQCTTH